MTEKERLAARLDQIRIALMEQDVSDESLAKLSRQLDEITIVKPPRRPQYRIRELKGLGKEFWRSIDVEKYLREERASWR